MWQKSGAVEYGPGGTSCGRTDVQWNMDRMERLVAEERCSGIWTGWNVLWQKRGAVEYGPGGTKELRHRGTASG